MDSGLYPAAEVGMTRYQRQLHHQARVYRASTARWRLYQQDHSQSGAFKMSNIAPENPQNGSNIDPATGVTPSKWTGEGRRFDLRRGAAM
jgi:hypothetical protein